MAGKQFTLGDGGTMMIRTLDVVNEATRMAERLGIAGQVEATVGRWDENGSIVGWTKKANRGADEVLVEVFVSDLNGREREFDSWAKRMQKLLAENAELKQRLALRESV